MSNSLFTIEIYKHAGTWCFTDEKRDLIHEPFVCGIPELINDSIKELDKSLTYRITFSENKFPGAKDYLRYLLEDSGGAWYSKQIVDQDVDKHAKNGWLCPATLKFFKCFPKKIYFAVESLTCL